MEEVNWYIGARITRSSGGGIHWFIESSDGLDGGHLVDEATPDTLMGAILTVRQEIFAELIRMYNAGSFQLRFPCTRPPQG